MQSTTKKARGHVVFAGEHEEEDRWRRPRSDVDLGSGVVRSR